MRPTISSCWMRISVIIPIYGESAIRGESLQAFDECI